MECKDCGTFASTEEFVVAIALMALGLLLIAWKFGDEEDCDDGCRIFWGSVFAVLFLVSIAGFKNWADQQVGPVLTTQEQLRLATGHDVHLPQDRQRK